MLQASIVVYSVSNNAMALSFSLTFPLMSLAEHVETPTLENECRQQIRLKKHVEYTNANMPTGLKDATRPSA